MDDDTFVFTLNIYDYCSIVPFKMSVISDYNYKVLDSKVKILFSYRADCYFGATFSA
jgi:hypothetical protein